MNVTLHGPRHIRTLDLAISLRATECTAVLLAAKPATIALMGEVLTNPIFGVSDTCCVFTTAVIYLDVAAVTAILEMRRAKRFLKQRLSYGCMFIHIAAAVHCVESTETRRKAKSSEASSICNPMSMVVMMKAILLSITPVTYKQQRPYWPRDY